MISRIKNLDLLRQKNWLLVNAPASGHLQMVAASQQENKAEHLRGKRRWTNSAAAERVISAG
jgi:hypothetical protein